MMFKYLTQEVEKIEAKHGRLSHKEALALIPGYLKDDLTEHELLMFLEHVSRCDECYEELETMFIVDRTINYLDANVDIAFDMKRDLIRDMRHKIKRMERGRVHRRLWRGFLFFTLIMTLNMLLDFFGVASITRFFIR